MGSREKILHNILQNQPAGPSLPSLGIPAETTVSYATRFTEVLEKIGGKAVEVVDWISLKESIQNHYPHAKRIVTTLSELPWYGADLSGTPHSFENVDLAILRGYFGVAENGAVWITDSFMGDRSIPFISQHLALVLDKKSIVPTLHEAYDKIDSLSYDYGTFIAGPSKTADIEQSLVLGAHGPKSMIVFLMAH